MYMYCGFFRYWNNDVLVTNVINKTQGNFFLVVVVGNGSMFQIPKLQLFSDAERCKLTWEFKHYYNSNIHNNRKISLYFISHIVDTNTLIQLNCDFETLK